METTWDNRGPIHLLYWGEQPIHFYCVRAMLVAVNGEMFAYDLRSPETPRFLGIFPAGDPNYREKLDRACAEVERLISFSASQSDGPEQPARPKQ